MYHASRLAGKHARSNGEDATKFQIVSGLLMAFMGCKMALDGFIRMQAKAGRAQMGGRGR